MGKKKKTEYGPKVRPTFLGNLSHISHLRLTKYPSREFCFPFAYIKTLEGNVVDAFYARTACHSALATTQNRNQITKNFTLRCCEIALRIFSTKIAPHFAPKAACANARKLLKL